MTEAKNVVSLVTKEAPEDSKEVAEAFRLAAIEEYTAVLIIGVTAAGELLVTKYGDLSQLYVLCDQAKAEILDEIEGEP